MQVRSLGWEDPLEEGMATYSNILDQADEWAVVARLSWRVSGR